MAADLVSIIIPVYGVERYLPQCMESVCGQSYSKLEILVIDDQSPDRSGEIADAFAKADSRVQVFHIANRGAAGARNFGLRQSTGDYVMFVDSDDWLEKDAVETMLKALHENQSNLVQCQYWDAYTTGEIPHSCDTQKRVISDEDFVRGMISRWEYILVWNKLFERAALENVFFEEGHCIDDEFFTYRVIMQSKRIAILPDCLYHYRHRQSGAMRDQRKAEHRWNDQIDFVTKRFAPLANTYPSLRPMLARHLVEVLFHVMREGNRCDEVFFRAKRNLLKYGVPFLFEKEIGVQTRKSIIRYLLSTRAGLGESRIIDENEKDCFL